MLYLVSNGFNKCGLAAGDIIGLSGAGYSLSVVVKRCKVKGLTISKSCVNSITLLHKNGFPPQVQCGKKLTRQRTQLTQRTAVVAKVRAAATQENPQTQGSIANRTSKGTVYRIIHENLGLEQWHKASRHLLKEQHLRER